MFEGEAPDAPRLQRGSFFGSFFSVDYKTREATIGTTNSMCVQTHFLSASCLSDMFDAETSSNEALRVKDVSAGHTRPVVENRVKARC